MLGIIGSIWMLAGTVLVAGGKIAKVSDTEVFGYLLMGIGFLLTLLGFWEVLSQRAAPHGVRSLEDRQ